MLFDLDNTEQGEGFKFFESRINKKGDVEYDDPKPDAATFFIRSIGPKIEEVQKKQKRIYEFVLNPKTRSMERVGYPKDQTIEEVVKERDDIFDYAITGWDDKALDARGDKIEVTRENKIRLMAMPVFDRFVARCFEILSSAGVKLKEDLEKN